MENNIEIINHFNTHSKTMCFLGVLKTEEGLRIERELLEWLTIYYDVVSIRQDLPGKLFEYPALSYMQKYCIENNIDYCLYIHTKGAYNVNPVQSHIRYFWKNEFAYKKDIYINAVNINEPIVVCPFTGKNKTTWYNGFFINLLAIKMMKPVTKSSNRFSFETLFKNESEIKVKGIIYNDVDDAGNNINSTSKIRAKQYVEDVYNNPGKYLISLKNTKVVIYNDEKIQFKTEYKNFINTLNKAGITYIDFRTGKYEKYSKFKGNEHHYTTKEHYSVFIPQILKMFNIDFNIDEYEYKNYVVNDRNNSFDLSYYVPKKNFNFSITIDRDKTYTGEFDILLGFNKNFPNPYHNLSSSSHRSCIITNNTIDNNRTLLISGDSHCVPQLAIFACYFKRIVFLDNRDKREMNIENIIPCSFDNKKFCFTDFLFSMYDRNSIKKYIYNNFLLQEKENKNVIYTCITNGYDNLIPPKSDIKGYDFICFSDVNFKDPYWKVILIPEKLKNLSPVKQQRYIKTHPHEFFKDYEYSIWVDANVQILKDPTEIILSTNGESVLIPQHPCRKCIYKEGRECIRLKKDTKENIDAQLNRYKNEGFPENVGLVQSNIVIRRHNEEDCIKLMEAWWNEIENGSHRDQLSFNYVLWKNKTRFGYLNKTLCNSKWFNWKVKHGITVKESDFNSTKSVYTNFGGNHDIIRAKIIEEPTVKADKVTQLPTPIKRIFY